MYVCVFSHTYCKSMYQAGKVANPARGQLNGENEYSPVFLFAPCEIDLEKQVQPSRPALSCSCPYSG